MQAKSKEWFMGVKSLAVGFAAGYVLGAKAGRKRYDQIVKVGSKVWNSKPVQAGVDKAQDAAGQAFGAAKSKVADAMPFGRGKAAGEDEAIVAQAVE